MMIGDMSAQMLQKLCADQLRGARNVVELYGQAESMKIQGGVWNPELDKVFQSCLTKLLLNGPLAGTGS